MSEQDKCHQNVFLETDEPKGLKKVILNEKCDRYDLVFNFGDRFQAVEFHVGASKEEVIRQLRVLSINIENDDLAK